MSDLEKPRIYLDYETNTKGFYYLVGYSFNGAIEQIVLTPKLFGMAEENNLKLTKPMVATELILELALREKAAIVAYSLAEKYIFSDLHEKHDLSRFAKVPYINLALAAKAWIRKYRKAEFAALGDYLPHRNLDPIRRRNLNNSLASRMRLTEMPPPRNYGALKTTQRFDYVMKYLEQNGQDYNELTPSQARKATNVLQHNQYDVKALPALFRAIYKKDIKCLKGRNVVSKCIDI